MPEIAEIRVVAKALRKQIIGKKIENVKILYSRIVVNEDAEFIEMLKGREFTGLDSYGKWLIFQLGDWSFLSHLRMEGKYYYIEREAPVDKHTHVIFELDDGMDLRYRDVRKFGRMELVETSKVFDNPSIKKLGYEPGDKRLTADYLLQKLEKNRGPIKTALLDQTIINGLGNIYSNEVLFASRISPIRPSHAITAKESEDIIEYSYSITKKSEEVGGSTIRSYTSSLGVIGHYQDYLKVHGKKGEPCPECGQPIVKIQVDGRGTYYCEHCQK